MIRRIRMGMAALAIGATGTAAAAPAAGAAPALSLRTSSTDVVHGRSVTLTGSVSDAPGGNSGRRVELEADEYPLGPSRFDRGAGSATTRSDGSFSVTARPLRNTRFRGHVSIGGTTYSASVLVYVDARSVFTVRPRPMTVALGAAYHFTRGTAAVPGVYFYARTSGSATYRRVGFRSFRRGRGLLAANASVRRSRRASFYAACTRRTPVVGMGRPGVDRLCGRSIVPRSAFG